MFLPNKSVCLVGPQSTGKTTLSNALKEKFGSNVILVQELARSVLKNFDCNTDDIFNDIDKLLELQKCILMAQCKTETQLTEQHKKYISDRSAVDPMVYAKFYLKPEIFQSLCDLDTWKTMKLMYQNQSEMLLILIEPNERLLRFDGVRKMPGDLEEWFRFHECFVSFMKENDIPYKIIPNECLSLQQRISMAMEWILNE